jgi:hypothetical protein
MIPDVPTSFEPYLYKYLPIPRQTVRQQSRQASPPYPAQYMDLENLDSGQAETRGMIGQY